MRLRYTSASEPFHGEIRTVMLPLEFALVLASLVKTGDYEA